MIYGKHNEYIATIEGIDWYNCKYLVKSIKIKNLNGMIGQISQ